jgi:hypothetical protein
VQSYEKKMKLPNILTLFFRITSFFFHTDGLLSILTLTVIFYGFNIKKILKLPNKKGKNVWWIQKKYYIKAIISQRSDGDSAW